MLIREQDPILYNIKTLIIFEITQPVLEKLIKIYGFLLIPDKNVPIAQHNQKIINQENDILIFLICIGPIIIHLNFLYFRLLKMNQHSQNQICERIVEFFKVKSSQVLIKDAGMENLRGFWII